MSVMIFSCVFASNETRHAYFQVQTAELVVCRVDGVDGLAHDVYRLQNRV